MFIHFLKSQFVKSIPRSLFISFFALLLSSSLVSAQSKQAENLTTIKLALNWKPEPEFGGFYEAQLRSFFTNEKLHVEIIEGGSGTPTAQLLANKKIDFGIVSADEIILANSKNKKNKIVALFAVYQKSPQVIIAHKERNFKSIRDVFANDGILAIQKGLPYADFLLKKYPNPKVKIVPYQGGIAPYLANEKYSQQGFSFSEPVLAEQAKQPATIFYVSDESFNPYTTVVATFEENLKNKDLIKRFVKAVRLGWLSYLKSPLEANTDMARRNRGMSPEIFKLASTAQVSLLGDPATLGLMTVERWAQLQDQMIDLQLVQERANPQSFFENF